MERGLINGVIQIVDKVRSRLLTKVLMALIEKLSVALESEVHRMMREVGRPLAQKISQIAQSWGHQSASKWKREKEFIQYLAVTAMNTPSTFQL
jgi:hypothetical protein